MSGAATREHWDDPLAAGARVLAEGVDTTHRGILYLDGISVSFDATSARQTAMPASIVAAVTQNSTIRVEGAVIG